MPPALAFLGRSFPALFHPRALVVGDLPWMSYHVSRDETVRNAAKLVEVNLGATEDDPRVRHVQTLVAVAAGASERALAAAQQHRALVERQTSHA